MPLTLPTTPARARVGFMNTTLMSAHDTANSILLSRQFPALSGVLTDADVWPYLSNRLMCPVLVLDGPRSATLYSPHPITCPGQNVRVDRWNSCVTTASGITLPVSDTVSVYRHNLTQYEPMYWSAAPMLDDAPAELQIELTPATRAQLRKFLEGWLRRLMVRLTCSSSSRGGETATLLAVGHSLRKRRRQLL